MKYCTHCGTQIVDEAVVCVNCGCATEEYKQKTASQDYSQQYKTIAKIFMLVGCILSGFTIIALCWTIPMTLHYYRCVDENKPVSLEFKICSLLFVSLIGGVFMLLDNENQT